MADPSVDEVARQMIQQHMDQCDERMGEIRMSAESMKKSITRIHERLNRAAWYVISMLMTILIAIGSMYLGLK